MKKNILLLFLFCSIITVAAKVDLHPKRNTPDLALRNHAEQKATKKVAMVRMEEAKSIISGPSIANKSSFSNFIRLPFLVHTAWLSLLGIVAAMIRFEPVAKIFESFIYVFPLGNFEMKKPPGYFKPLGIINWAAHLITYSLSLELAGGLLSLKQRSNEARAKKTYNGFFAVYALGCIQSLFVLLQHTIINVNPKLETGLAVWEWRLIQLAMFGTGLSVSIGLWTLIPVFLGITFDRLTFGNWPGRLLATYSMYKYSSKEVSKMFSLGYLSLGLVAAVCPIDPSLSDANHAIVTMILNIIFAAMAFSLNQTLHNGL